MLAGHRGERRRRRHRRRLGGHVQGRVAQPPVLRRALPGRGHRGRRHRARHHGDGRAAGRGGRSAAVRAGRRAGHPRGCCPAWSPASAATATRLGPAEHRRRGRLRRVLRGQPAGQRAVRGRDARRGPAPGVRVRRRQQDHPVRRAHRARRHRRRLGAGVSETFDGDEIGRPAARSCPSVQVGDPFTEKVLIECCLELFARRAGGRHPGPRRRRAVLRHLASWPAPATAACTSSWTRSRCAPPGMTPAEILSSESQERMCAVVTPENVDAFLAVCRKWDVAGHRDRRGHRRRPAGDHLARRDRGRRAAAHRRPRRPGLPAPGARVADDQDALVADTPDALPRPRRRASCARRSCGWRPAPTCAAARWVTDQYDRYVRGNTVLAQPADAGHDPGRRGRPAAGSPWPPTATPGSSRSTRTPARSWRWPRRTATWPPPARCRWPSPTASTSARPEDPHVMWQFQQAVRGLADGCAQLGIPVTGGNVSFYNQTGAHADPADAGGRRARRDRRRAPARAAGFGRRRRDADPARRHPRGVRRSSWAHVVHGHLGGVPPAVDLAPSSGWPLLLAGSRDGLLTAAHDLSEGGLAQALVEAAWSARPAAGSCCPGRRPVRGAVLRVGRPRAGRGAAHRGDAVHRDVHARAAAVGADRRGRRGVRFRRGAGPVLGLRWPSCATTFEGTLPALFG